MNHFNVVLSLKQLIAYEYFYQKFLRRNEDQVHVSTSSAEFAHYCQVEVPQSFSRGVSYLPPSHGSHPACLQSCLGSTRQPPQVCCRLLSAGCWTQPWRPPDFQGFSRVASCRQEPEHLVELNIPLWPDMSQTWKNAQIVQIYWC